MGSNNSHLFKDRDRARRYWVIVPHVVDTFVGKLYFLKLVVLRKFGTTPLFCTKLRQKRVVPVSQQTSGTAR